MDYPPHTTPTAGSILTNSTGKTPTGYLSCDGRAVSKTEFPTLYQAVGTLYGETNVTNAFVLPNLEDLNGSGIFYIIKI
jgi:microcystin-dependent protein